ARIRISSSVFGLSFLPSSVFIAQPYSISHRKCPNTFDPISITTLRLKKHTDLYSVNRNTMSISIEPINKISRPRLTGVFERERIFQLLNDARRHPVVWISAPAGAGKTTLIASYLESLHLPAVWYQIDPRDNDPATFFYYLSLAVKRASPRKRKPIPLLTPEFMPGIDAFALRYFEAVYQRLPKPLIFVLDNYQLINPGSIIHELISSGLSILPEKITGVVISREHPPAAFSRMLANRIAVQIG
ncbi:MAG: hypothetical protein P8175_10010, partial [Deltaproteobacteria bacterium]